jgi:predicted metal-dependent peptidase
VAEYINKKRVNAECVLVFTDGYVESDVEWQISAPTLWMVTENESWIPPTGKKVMVKE